MQRKNHVGRIAIGIGCIGIALLTLLWFTSNFAPGTPRDSHPKQGYSSWSIAGISANPLQAESVIDIPFDTEWKASGLTAGTQYSVPQDYLEDFSEKERLDVIQAPDWKYQVDDFSLTVGTTKVVSGEVFAGLYPHYADADPNAPKTLSESVFFMIEVTATSTSDVTAEIPISEIKLWSEEFFGADSDLGAGISQGKYLIGEFFGTASEDFVANEIEDGWNVLEPGETTQIALAYCVNKGYFLDPYTLEDIDLSKFCLTLCDYDPPTTYRLWLG